MEEEYDPYEILGVRKDATKQELKKAYHRKLLQTHPDATGQKTAHLFEQVQEAYHTVRYDLDKREIIDGAYATLFEGEGFTCPCGESFYIKKGGMFGYGKMGCRGCSNYFWIGDEEEEREYLASIKQREERKEGRSRK